MRTITINGVTTNVTDEQAKELIKTLQEPEKTWIDAVLESTYSFFKVDNCTIELRDTNCDHKIGTRLENQILRSIINVADVLLYVEDNRFRIQAHNHITYDMMKNELKKI